jgi:hypothetical protein
MNLDNFRANDRAIKLSAERFLRAFGNEYGQSSLLTSHGQICENNESLVQLKRNRAQRRQVNEN